MMLMNPYEGWNDVQLFPITIVDCLLLKRCVAENTLIFMNMLIRPPAVMICQVAS